MPQIKDPPDLKIEKHFEIPSIPVVLTRIIQALDSDRVTAQELEDLILHDPSLSARILKLANSAFYSFRSEVRTISHAIPLLGINLVKSLAIGVSVFESFTKGMKSEAVFIQKLWMHSFGSGLLAQEIWKPRTTRKEGEFAFLCGLLHDLGEVVFFKRDPEKYSVLFARQKKANEPDLCALETDAYGLDHATAGALLAKEWGFPPELAQVIRYHHDPLKRTAPVTAAVSLADALARAAHIGYDGDDRPTVPTARIRQQLSMSLEEYVKMQKLATERKVAIEEFFAMTA
jgi:putative nucleotidyltransferase with HDIG domain